MRSTRPWGVWLCLAALPACHHALPVPRGTADGDGDAVTAADAADAAIPDGGPGPTDGLSPGASDTAGDAAAVGLCGGVVQLAAGLSHVCAVKADGTLWCWGANGYGQLGDGTYVDRAAPTAVAVLGADVVQVAAGEEFTCARKRDGTVWCWGDNFMGQLGTGDTSVQAVTIPAPVAALGATVADVAAGGERACARLGDGTLWCWGNGYPGDGSSARQLATPMQVTALGATVASVSLSRGDICARKTDGSLWCWGDNSGGQLGNGSTQKSTVPIEVTALGHAVASVSSSYQDTCATKTDGTLFCWGYRNDSATPAQMASLGADVVQVAVGEGHTCARKHDGTLWCWGGNNRGQLGDGTTFYRDDPVQVAGLAGTLDVAVSSGFTCAVAANAALRCWGANEYGQLGTGANDTQTTPRAVASLGAGVAQLAAGYFSFCARKTDGSVWCWGRDATALLANGSPVYQPIPVEISALGRSVAQVAAGDAGTVCALGTDGGVWCWGQISNASGTFDVQAVPRQITGPPPNIVEIAVGWGHACALAGDGALWCWGRDDDGQLGNGSPTLFSATPIQVSGLGKTAAHVVASGANSCASLGDGTLWCWGNNDAGQLGNGTTEGSALPVAVTTLGPHVRQFSVSPTSHACACLDDGTAWCWGNNDHGELGDGSQTQSPIPVRARGLDAVVEISAGASTTCARLADGALWCWGRDSVGQLGVGRGGQGVMALAPVRVVAPGRQFVEVSAGLGATCARDVDGGVWCWGMRSFGMLADGSIGSTLTPAPPAGCR
jgi:alpha-tubulin suppressor-like RCC1 family protein